MASSRLVPALVAAGVGVIGGIYIWQAPMQELSGKGGPKGVITEGRSQSVKDNDSSPSTTSPMPALREGGAAPPRDDSAQTVAGTSSSSRRSGSADTDVKIRKNANEQDGTSGGGQGVAEMRERKMKGMGGPSPQGGDTGSQTVKAQKAYAEH